MMQKREAVTAGCMIIAITDTRVSDLPGPAAIVVQQTLREAVHLQLERAVNPLRAVRRLIHQAAVLQRRVTVLWTLMMKGMMRYMKMTISIGTDTARMMIMLPVWMMRWKIWIGRKKGDNAYEK